VTGIIIYNILWDGKYILLNLECQAEDDATSVSSEVEEKLNREGLFDEEIEALPEAVKEGLSNGNEYKVVPRYSEMVETDEGTTFTRELREEEIDDYIVDEFSDYIDEKVSDNKNFIEKLWDKIKEKLGFKKISYRSKRRTTEARGDSQKGSKFKHSLLLERKKGSKIFTVTYVFDWLEKPTWTSIPMEASSEANATYLPE